jgi:hypothetical protein
MLMVWLLVLFGLLLVGFFGVTLLRRHLRAEDTGTGGEAFSLGDLRSMLKRNQISQEEYDRLRGQIIATVKKPDEKPKTPPLRPEEPPEE